MPVQLDIIEHMLVSEIESGETALSSDDLAQFVDRLAAADDTAADAELIDQITQLERMKWVRLFWRDVGPPKPPGAVLVGLGLVLAGGC